MPTSRQPSRKCGPQLVLAVIDTSVWLAALLRPDGFAAAILPAVRAKKIEPVFCPATLHELTAVLHRPRFGTRYAISAEAVADFLRAIMRAAHSLSDPPIVPITRDPKDDIFVALAISSDADFLVTRDDDLKRDLQVVEYLAAAGCEVISVRAFLEKLG